MKIDLYGNGVGSRVLYRDDSVVRVSMKMDCWDRATPAFENTARSKEVPSTQHWFGLGFPSLRTLRNKPMLFVNYPDSVIVTQGRQTQQHSNKTLPAQSSECRDHCHVTPVGSPSKPSQPPSSQI